MDFRRCVIIALITLGCGCSAYAVTFGQIDNFQDGTTLNWENGGALGVPPVLNIDTGGPGGAGDHFMQITGLGGNRVGGRLTVFNRVQWPGDYINQGVTTIEMDLNNFSNMTLSIRLAFKSDQSFASPGYLSQPFILNSGSGWQHCVFAIAPATMIPIGGPVSFDKFFSSGNSELRIIHEVGANDLMGDPVAAQLGTDNIHAVPEPRSFLLAAVGLLAVTVVRNWKRRNSS